jgi:hypothetical protein
MTNAANKSTGKTTPMRSLCPCRQPIKNSLKDFVSRALFQYRKSAKVDRQEKKQTQDDVDVRPTCFPKTRSEIANTPCRKDFFRIILNIGYQSFCW